MPASFENDKRDDYLTVSYFLSRFDDRALEFLGYSGFKQAFLDLSNILGVKPNTIKNMRDEFDPYFPNARRGWYQREIEASRKAVFDKYKDYTEEKMQIEVTNILNKYKSFSKDPDDILIDLDTAIINAHKKFESEFKFQDIELSEEFKNAYKDFLEKRDYDIEYSQYSAKINTQLQKNIYLPNQWFVIAAYGVGVYKELQRYKFYFLQVTGNLNVAPGEYASKLRNCHSPSERKQFIQTAKEIFIRRYSDASAEKAAEQLWRFVSDYDWWNGKKTIDRHDYYLSCVLNMLNLLAASQSYVATLIDDYANNEELFKIAGEMQTLTSNLKGTTYEVLYKDRFEVNNNIPEYNNSGEIDSTDTSSDGNNSHSITIYGKSLEKLHRK